MSKTIPSRLRLPLAGAVLAALLAGVLVGRWSERGETAEPAAGPTEAAPPAPTVWTCSMHPQIQLPDPGPCPVCGMDLIPLAPGAPGGPRALSLSPEAAALADVETTKVERRPAERELRLVGKVVLDESRTKFITARIPGRLDRLYVDSTGTPVGEGDHLVDLYSPDLLSAQEELLQAAEALSKLRGGGTPLMRQAAERTVASARNKLRLWGLKASQVAELERSRRVSEHVTIHAPTGGVVTHKNKNLGDYVQTGERIYTIADLSQVWIQLDAYESDLPWVRYGQAVEFQVEAYPGAGFESRISFIDPILKRQTRTVAVRLTQDNADQRLKPGMFVRAVVRARLDSEGKVRAPLMQGKWICPMHGEVLRDAPGPCDLCGMPLVAADSVHPAEDTRGDPLVVPATAVLWTGVRSVVYVRLDGDSPAFEGREVVLGPRTREGYVILAGLREGERVVTRGAFKIDSALQIQAKPSMMLPPPPAPTQLPSSPELLEALAPLYDAYEALRGALAGDDPAGARAAAEALASAIEGVDSDLVEEGEAQKIWVGLSHQAAAAAREAASAETIDASRAAFQRVSQQVLILERRVGHRGPGSHYEVYCSMAFDDQGASWLQPTDEVSNPYFGASMLRCGEVRETFPGEPANAEVDDR